MNAYTLLAKPLTLREIMSHKTEDDYIEGVIAVDIEDLINNDLEGVLDMLSEQLTNSYLLMSMGYEVVGHEGNTLHMKVWGDVSMIIERETEENRGEVSS